MIELKSLANISFETIYNAFSEAFRDYEITLTEAELQKMLFRRGFHAELSFGAFEDDRLVSFTLNGIGLFNGVKTAYDTGTGTLPNYRAKGLAAGVFNESIPTLVSNGVVQYLLEVLQHNESAVSIYTKQGFAVSREFNYFVRDVADINLNGKELPNGYSIREIFLIEIGIPNHYWDFEPSWQNSFESINRNPTDFIVIGAFHGNALIGYGIIEPSSGDITQIGVDKLHRRRGVGSAILKELVKRNIHDHIKVINTEIGCDSITAFLANNHIEVKGKQFEMIKKLH